MRDWITERILAPSRKLDLILDLDVLRDTVEVRSTIIYESRKDKGLIVSQTSPPILTSRVGQKVSATYLALNPKTGEQERYGFQTEILRFIPEYRLRRGVRVQALGLAYPRSEICRTHARLLHRVSLIPAHGLQLAVRGLAEEEEITLLDISLGGFLFSYKGYTELKKGRRILVNLVQEEPLLTLEADVIRVFEREGSRMMFVGCRFADLTPIQVETIRNLVQGIMRLDLRSRSGLEDGAVVEDEPGLGGPEVSLKREPEEENFQAMDWPKVDV